MKKTERSRRDLHVVMLLPLLVLFLAVGGCHRAERPGGSPTAARGKVKVGDRAPDFRLPSQSGDLVSLGGSQGKKAVVLYFYPKDNTPGCTSEACAFRDSYEVFKDAGAEVIGVSSDSVDSHKQFAEKHNLPFTLVSDEGGKLRDLYGVPSTLGLAGRVTYVIDKNGIVRHIFSSQMRPKRHIREALKTLKALAQ